MDQESSLPPELLSWLKTFSSDNLRYSKYVWYFLTASIGFLLLLRVLKIAQSKSNGPAFINSLIAFWHKYITYQIVPFLGLKLGEVIIIASYFAVILSFSFAQTSTSPGPLFIQGYLNRCGHIAISTMPFLILLAGRNNLISLVLGIEYERLRIYHFWTARMTLLLALLHAIGRLKQATHGAWPIESQKFGLLAFTSCCLLFVGSINLVMKWSYEVFFVVHVITVAIFIGGAYKHQDTNHKWLYAAIAVWAFDRFVRLLRIISFNEIFRFKSNASSSNHVPAKIFKVSEDTLRLEIHKPDIPNWRPGSHAFLTELGGVHWFPQGHPFSIASIPKIHSASSIRQNDVDAASFQTSGLSQSNPFADPAEISTHQNTSEQLKLNPISHSTVRNGDKGSSYEEPGGTLRNNKRILNDKTLVFIIRIRSGWTRHLARHAESLIEKEGEDPGMGKIPKPLRLNFLVDAPYSGHHLKDEVDSLILIAGGSGVSWTLPYLSDLVLRSSGKESVRVKKLTWIWIVRQEDHLNWIFLELSQILSSMKFCSINISLQFYCTSKTSGRLSSSTSAIQALHLDSNSNRAVRLQNGRPDFDSIFEECIDSNEKSLVACSGPGGMSSVIRENVRKLLKPGSADNKEFKCEEFGW